MRSCIALIIAPRLVRGPIRGFQYLPSNNTPIEGNIPSRYLSKCSFDVAFIEKAYECIPIIGIVDAIFNH